MKLVNLKNQTSKRINIVAIRNLTFSPGEAKKVHPSVASHPAVRRYLNAGILVTFKEKAVIEPIAETVVSVPEPKIIKVISVVETPEPIEEPVIEPIAEIEESNDPEVLTTELNMRSIYLAAPGITEANVDAIVNEYATMDDLKKTDSSTLKKLGVKNNQVKKVLNWVKKQ